LQGPFIVVQKLSDLNYKILGKKGKEFVVHINRLKKSCYQTPWSFENACLPKQNTRQLDTETLDGNVEIKSRPVATGDERDPQVVETQAWGEEQLQLVQDPQLPGNVETPAVDRNSKGTPDSSVQDPDYERTISPRSRRELSSTRIATPVTKSRARLQLQENHPVSGPT